MRFAHYKLLRRTAILIGAASALALALPASAQGTATLVGASGTTCNYSQMTVQPNGNISISCNTSGASAIFNFTGSPALATNASGAYTITRSGGSESTIAVNWSATGACTTPAGSATLAAGASAPFTVTTGATGGTCVLAATPAAGTATNLNVTVSGGSDPPPVSGCPTPQAGYKPQTLGWSPHPLELRMESGVIASFPIPAPNTSKASVKLTQGQQQMSPGDGTSEMSISKCPGVIDTTNASCYSTTSNGNNFTVSKDAYTKSIYTFNNQTSLAWRGCWAPGSEGQWYVNVRWTYANSCYGLACGYSMQWAPGAY
jgi:hypothetical protein